MARRLLLIVLIFMSANLRAQTSVTFSVQAHADDWQLFMSAKLVADLNLGVKVVFITLTAGDASAGAASYGASGIPFYLSRENGSVYAAKYLSDLTSGTAPLVNPTATTQAINGHNITKYTYKGIVNYFLRLPDGNGNGNGFSNTGFVSLEKLRAGSISSISALGDVPATYTSWTDLTNTIKQIFTNEKVTGTQAWIYAAHTLNGSNSAYNPGDHSDHRFSSMAAQDAVASGMAWVGVNGFMDYASSYINGPLVVSTDHENATALFGLTNWGLIEAGYSTNFITNHLEWVPYDYFQVIKTPSGNAPFAGFAETDNGSTVTTDTDKGSGSLLRIPIIVSITNPAFADKDINMLISPYETGTLSTIISDQEGKKVFGLETKVENKDPLFVTLKQPVKAKGVYIIQTILNGKYTESRKITVE